jgi:hypothetical protein
MSCGALCRSRHFFVSFVAGPVALAAVDIASRTGTIHEIALGWGYYLMD